MLLRYLTMQVVNAVQLQNIRLAVGNYVDLVLRIFSSITPNVKC